MLRGLVDVSVTHRAHRALCSLKSACRGPAAPAGSSSSTGSGGLNAAADAPNRPKPRPRAGVPVVEGLAGFAAVPVRLPTPSSSSSSSSSSSFSSSVYYASTVPSPKIALERLSKELAGVAHGPVNLLEVR